jgi:hypothetical protein
MAEIGRINVNDLAKTITVHVTITGHKSMWVKMCIGKFLIRLGIWIIGMKGEVEIMEI